MSYEDRREFANEVASMTRERVVVAAARIAEAEQPQAFVGEMTWNKARDHRRAEERRRKREVSTDDPEHLVILPPTRSLSPEELLLRNERAEHARAAIDRLSARSARVLRMYYLDEMTSSEIAALESETREYINTLVSRARNELREILKADGCAIRGQPGRPARVYLPPGGLQGDESQRIGLLDPSRLQCFLYTPAGLAAG